MTKDELVNNLTIERHTIHRRSRPDNDTPQAQAARRETLRQAVTAHHRKQGRTTTP